MNTLFRISLELWFQEYFSYDILAKSGSSVIEYNFKNLPHDTFVKKIQEVKQNRQVVKTVEIKKRHIIVANEYNARCGDEEIRRELSINKGAHAPKNAFVAIFPELEKIVDKSRNFNMSIEDLLKTDVGEFTRF